MESESNNAIFTVENVQSSGDRSAQPQHAQCHVEKTKQSPAADLTHHVIGAVLNLLAALCVAADVTALQLILVKNKFLFCFYITYPTKCFSCTFKFIPRKEFLIN